jgi:hypothetical protein
MAYLITNGRKRQPKNSIGGVRSVYFAPFKKVLRSQIALSGVNLLAFPQTFVYRFEAFGSTFTQTQSEDAGGKSFKQNISLSFNKISAFDNVRFEKMIRNDYFCVVEDKNGNFVLAGFRNGLECNTLSVSTSGSYQLTFEGQEESFAPFCANLIGTVFVPINRVDYILQNNDDYILENNDNYILNQYGTE